MRQYGSSTRGSREKGRCVYGCVSLIPAIRSETTARSTEPTPDQELVGASALTVIAVLVAGGLAPFALHERRSSGSVADTTAPLTGQAGIASEGLRRLGYACSDSAASRGVVTRVCTRVRRLESSRVRLVAAAETGAVQLATTTLDEERSAQASRRQVLEVLADAVGLEPADRSRVLAAAAGNANQSLRVRVGVVAWACAVSGPPARVRPSRHTVARRAAQPVQDHPRRIG